MAFDFTKLIPLGESLAAAGLPAIGGLLSKVVPFPFSLAVEPLFNAVAGALNVDPAAPDAPAQVQAKVQADPAAAATVLAPIESTHKEMADAANDELRIRTADVQDARATEVRYIEAKSPIAYAPPVISTIVTLGFYGIVAAVFAYKSELSVNQAALLNILIGASIAAFTQVINYWLGSSSSSRTKDEALIGIAKQPQVIQGPGSHVSGGVAPAGRR